MQMNYSCSIFKNQYIIETIAQYKIFNSSTLQIWFCVLWLMHHKIQKAVNLNALILTSALNFKHFYRHYHRHNFQIYCPWRPFDTLETILRKYFFDIHFPLKY